MAHSYVDFRKNHIQLRDEQVFVVMAALMEKADLSSCGDSIRQLVEWWTRDGVNSGPGCIEMPLDDVLTSEDAIGELGSLLSVLGKSFREHPELVKGEALNTLVGGERFRFENQDGSLFADACEKLAALITGSSKLAT